MSEGFIIAEKTWRADSKGYVFKKGQSWSKIYGQSDIPKIPKYDTKAREERIVTIGEELSDISWLLAYKEKSHCQAENALHSS